MRGSPPHKGGPKARPPGTAVVSSSDQVALTFERRVRLCDIDGMYTPIAPEKWQKLYAEHIPACSKENCRRFIVAVYWILRTGAQWRALPERFGKWNSVYRRFARWEDRGILAELHDYFVCDDRGHSTVQLCAPICALWAVQKGVAARKRLGCHRDAVGFPLRFGLNPCLRLSFDAFIGDKGYDSDHLRDLLETNQVEVVVPSRRHRKQQPDYDKLRYKGAICGERFINKIKWRAE